MCKQSAEPHLQRFYSHKVIGLFFKYFKNKFRAGENSNFFRELQRKSLLQNLLKFSLIFFTLDYGSI